MGLFNQFPWTNFDRVNLDALMAYVRTLDEKVDQYLAYATITYADPLQWDITTQYQKNTVVVSYTGEAYLSVQPVPAGIAITDTDYWTPIGDFSQLWGDLKSAICSIDLGDSITATQDIQQGDLFFCNNMLFQADVYIPNGTAITSSVCSQVTIEGLLGDVLSDANTYTDTQIAGAVFSDSYDSVNKRIVLGQAGSSPVDSGDTVEQFLLGNDIIKIPSIFQLFGASCLIYTVGPGGNYSTINDALTIANNEQGSKVILIAPGTYNEKISLLPSNDITLFGLGEVTIVGDGTYPEGCLYAMGKFAAYNIRFQTLGTGEGYAFHYEDAVLGPSGRQIFVNCEFYGADANAVGIGLGSNTITFRNCRMTSGNSAKSAIYAHNSAAGSGKSGYLILDNCRLDGRVRLDDVSTQYSTDNKIDVQFFGCSGTTIFEFYDYSNTYAYVPDSQKVTLSAVSAGNCMPAMNYRTRNKNANRINVIMNSVANNTYITCYYQDASRYNWTLASTSISGATFNVNNTQQGSFAGNFANITGTQFGSFTFAGEPHN